MTARGQGLSRRAFVGAAGALALAPLLGGCRTGSATPRGTLRVHLRLTAYERAFFERAILPAFARDHGLSITWVDGTGNEVLSRLGDPQAGIDLITVDTERLGPLIAGRLLQPLDDQRDALGTPPWRGMLPALEAAGTLYALPYRPTVWVSFYDRALLDAARLAPPPTWDETLRAAERLAETGATARIALQGGAGEPGARTLTELIWAFGGDPLAPAEGGALAAGAFLARLGPRLAAVSREGSFATMTRALGTGEVAIGPNWPSVATDLIQRGGQPQIAAYPGPAGPQGGARLLSGQALAVPRSAPGADGARRFAAFLRDPAIQATLARELAWPPAIESALDAVPAWQRGIATATLAALRGARALPPLAHREEFDGAMGDAFRSIAFGGAAAEAALQRAAGAVRGIK